MDEVKVEIGPVVMPKATPIPDVWVCQRLVYGAWLTENVTNEKLGRQMAERNGQPYRIIRIPGSDAKGGK